MSDKQQTIANFKWGLDGRRSELVETPGSLIKCENAHINSGGEIEQRLTFAKQNNNFPNATSATLATSTFGLEATASGLVTFGSLTPAPVLPTGVSYCRCVHPTGYNAVGVAYMTGVVSSCNFNGKAFVVVIFSDNRYYAYFGDVSGMALVGEVNRNGISLYQTAGNSEGLSNLATDLSNLLGTQTILTAAANSDTTVSPAVNYPGIVILQTQQSTHIGVVASSTNNSNTAGLTAFLVDQNDPGTQGVQSCTSFYLGNTTNGGSIALCAPTKWPAIPNTVYDLFTGNTIYSPTGVRIARHTTNRQKAGGTATLTLVGASPMVFQVGDFVTITGLGGSGYNLVNVQLTGVTSTTISYALAGTESITADTNGVVTPVTDSSGNPNIASVVSYVTSVAVTSQNIVNAVNANTKTTGYSAVLQTNGDVTVIAPITFGVAANGVAFLGTPYEQKTIFIVNSSLDTVTPLTVTVALSNVTAHTATATATVVGALGNVVYKWGFVDPNNIFNPSNIPVSSGYVTYNCSCSAGSGANANTASFYGPDNLSAHAFQCICIVTCNNGTAYTFFTVNLPP